MSGEHSGNDDDYVSLGTPSTQSLGTPSTQSIFERLKRPLSTPPPTQVVPKRRTPPPASPPPASPPPSTQIMPARLKKAIVEAEAEIQGLLDMRGLLLDDRKEAIERVEENRSTVSRMSREIKEKERLIKRDKAEIQDLDKRMEKLQDVIKSKQGFIDKCNSLYP